MPKPWSEVESNPGYIALSDDDKAAAQEQYFDEVVRPRVRPEDADLAKSQFMERASVSKNKQAPIKTVQEEPTFMENLGSGAFKTMVAAPTQAALWLGEKAGISEPGSLDKYTKQVESDLALLEKGRGERSGTNWVQIAGEALPLVATGLSGGALLQRLGINATAANATALQSALADLVGSSVSGGLAAAQLFTPSDETKAGQIATGTVAGPVGEAIGSMIGNVAKRVAKPMGDLGEAAYRKIAGAKKTGLPLSAGDITASKPIAAVEGALSSTLGGSGVVQDFRDAQARSLSGQASELLEAGPVSAAEAGEAVGQGVKKRLSVFKSLASEAFDSIEQAAGVVRDSEGKVIDKGVKIPLSDFKANLDDITQSETAKISLKDKKLFDDINQIVDAFDGMPDYLAVKDIRQALSDKAGSPDLVNTKDRRLLYQLIRKLDDDVVGWSDVMGKDVADAWKTARSLWAGEMGVTRGKVGAKVEKLMQDGGLEKVMDTYFRPNNVSDLNSLKRFVGDDGFDALKQSWLTGLLKRTSTTVHPRLGAEPFETPTQKLVTAIKGFDDETLDAILTPREKSNLLALVENIKATEAAQKMVANPSGTASRTAAIGAIQAVGGAAIGGATTDDKVKGIAEGLALGVIAPRVAAKMLLSKAGTKYLSTGFDWSNLAAQGIKTGAEKLGSEMAVVREAE